MQSAALDEYGAVTGILIALYLGAVVFNGNTQKLVTQLASEQGFILWGVSLLVLWFVIKELPGNLGAWVGVLAFAALALIAGNKVFPQLQTIFKGN